MTTSVPTSKQRWSALIVLVSAVLLLAIDGTVLYLALPSLTEDLDPTAEQVLWIGDIYSLALAGLLVVMGTLADRIGRKRLLLIGATGFGLVSVFAAFASSAEMLIAARLLLGIAGATIMPTTLALLRNIFPDDRERTKAIAIWSAAAGAGAAVGPLVGGLLLEYFWWGSVFLINVPIMLIVIVAGHRLLPESKNPEPGRFDLLSGVLAFVAMTSFVYALKKVAGADGVDGQFFIFAVIALATGWIFALRQTRLEQPMLDLTLFRRPAFAGAVGANVIAIFALVGSLFFFSQYLQYARGLSPLEAGLAELPATIAGVAVIVVIGVVVAWLGRGRAIALGLFLTAAGLVGLGLAVADAPYVFLALGLLVIGLGVGLAMTLSADAVMSAAPPDKAGGVAAISETGYEVGIVLGIAVLGSLLGAMYRNAIELPGRLVGEARARVEDSFGSALGVVELDSAIGQAAREAFITAMQLTSYIAAALVAVAGLVAWWLIPADHPSDQVNELEGRDRVGTASG